MSSGSTLPFEAEDVLMALIDVLSKIGEARRPKAGRRSLSVWNKRTSKHQANTLLRIILKAMDYQTQRVEYDATLMHWHKPSGAAQANNGCYSLWVASG
jgi:hypothetical protein